MGPARILIGREVRIRGGNCPLAHDQRNGCARRGQKAAKSCQSEHHAILKVIPTNQEEVMPGQKVMTTESSCHQVGTK